MFCPSCGSELRPVATEELVSQDKWGGDYYTHRCLGCSTNFHLHIRGDGSIALISTGAKQEIASKKIIKDLAIVLREKATELEKV